MLVISHLPSERGTCGVTGLNTKTISIYFLHGSRGLLWSFLVVSACWVGVVEYQIHGNIRTRKRGPLYLTGQVWRRVGLTLRRKLFQLDS